MVMLEIQVEAGLRSSAQHVTEETSKVPPLFTRISRHSIPISGMLKPSLSLWSQSNSQIQFNSQIQVNSQIQFNTQIQSNSQIQVQHNIENVAANEANLEAKIEKKKVNKWKLFTWIIVKKIGLLDRRKPK